MPWRRVDVGVVFAVALMGVVAGVDLTSGRSITLAAALATPPFVAAAMSTSRRTTPVAVASVALAAALLAHAHAQPPAVIAVRASVVVVSAVVAVAVARGRERRARELATMTHVAEVAQLAVLSPVPPVAGPVALSSAYLSATREALIGGDFYGVAETPRGIRLVVGDVRGKGLDAVQLAAVVLSTFREAAAVRPTLPELVVWMDQRLRPHLGNEDFATAVLADIGDDGTLDLVSCGHPPPVLVHAATQRLVEVTTPAAPLGLEPEPDVMTLHLDVGDRLLFYTDGLVEARGRRGRFVDVDTVLAGLATDPFDTAVDNVLSRLRVEAADLRDDLALLLVEFHGRP